jgi:hypothetical protein
LPASVADFFWCQNPISRYEHKPTSTGAIQHEHAHQTLPDATREYERLLKSVFDGSYDPSQPRFRADLED